LKSRLIEAPPQHSEPAVPFARASGGLLSHRSTWVGLAGAAVLVAAVVLRFWSRSDLWLDEANTVSIAGLPLSRIPDALRHDGSPPLYYVLLHGWMRVFGTGDLAVRSLSGIVAVATLPLMWFAGRRVGGRPGGWVALLLLGSSPFAVRYATEARMYSLVVLLVVCGYLALSRVLERPQPRLVDVAALTVVTALLLYTHYWALYLVVVVAALLAWRIWTRPSNRTAPTWALAALAGATVMFLPWVPTFVTQLLHTGTPWGGPDSFGAMVNAVGEFAGGSYGVGPGLALIFLALTFLALFGLTLDGHRIELDLRTRQPSRALALATAGTIALAITASLVTKSAFQARYASVVLPIFLLLAVLGAATLGNLGVRRAMVAVAVGLGLVASASNVTTSRTQAGQVAATIKAAAKPGDVVGYCPDQLGPSVSRLLPSTVVQFTFPASQTPQRVDWYDYRARNAAGQPTAFARTLAARAGAAHNIWYVWIGGYKTLAFKCEAVISQLAALRPGAAGTDMIVTSNGFVITNPDAVSGARTLSVTQVVKPDTKAHGNLNSVFEEQSLVRFPAAP
jgi:hypothetical protein